MTTALTPAQVQVIAKINQGQNVFLTGQAGTGKSFVLKHLLQKFHEDPSISYGLTATTGAAATLVHGRTVHSFLGIGLGKKSATEMAYLTRTRKKKIYQQILQLHILIIDEISMMHDDLLQKIHDYLCILRNSEKPFGGIQMLLCGDLLQLPPIDGNYCIHAPIWKDADFHVIVLSDIHRQTNDLFRSILARARMGEITEEDIAILQTHCIGQCPPHIQPTRLFPLNRDVLFTNEIAYERVKAKTAATMTYMAMYSGAKGKAWGDSMGIPETLELCVNAQVMVTVNIPQTPLINGSRGVITAVMPQRVQIQTVDGELHWITPHTLQDESEQRAQIRVIFMPLCLAWAISHHKSQGATLDAVELDLGPSVFAYGQGYTALSRCKTMENIKLLNISKKAFRAHPEMIQFYKNHME